MPATKVPQTHATKQQATTPPVPMEMETTQSNAVSAPPANQTGSEKEVLPNVNNVQILRPTKFGLP